MRLALRQARLRASLTQVELARRAGLSRAAYTNIEKGYRHPSLAAALRIACVLNEPVEELFADEPFHAGPRKLAQGRRARREPAGASRCRQR